jgi:hypothetical protein
MCCCTSIGIMVCAIFFESFLPFLYGFRISSVLLTLYEVRLKIETSYLDIFA